MPQGPICAFWKLWLFLVVKGRGNFLASHDLQQSCRAESQEHFPYITCPIWTVLRRTVINLRKSNKNSQNFGGSFLCRKMFCCANVGKFSSRNL